MKGLCSSHYQRQRRQEKDGQGKVGRPREYPEETGGGAPRITVRLEPELLDWVREQGGGGWLRHVSRELRDLSKQTEFQNWWKRLASPTEQGSDLDEIPPA